MHTKLKSVRIEMGLSQLELSAASNVGRWAIQIYEAGVRLPGPEEQQALAEALGKSVAEVFPISKPEVREHEQS